jgi:hypothetical protein
LLYYKKEGESIVKRLKCILGLALLILLIYAVPALAAPTVTLNGQQPSFDVSPVIENGQPLVPLRVIFESLGANVLWDEQTQTVTATQEGTEIKLTLGQAAAFKNGAPIILAVPAKTINDRTMVPFNFISEALGVQVKWDENKETISITTTPSASDADKPSVYNYFPANNVADVQANSQFVLTFNEPVSAGNGLIVIYQALDGSVAAIINANAATINGAEVTFKPAAELSLNQSYYIYISPGAFRNVAGNEFPGITNNTDWKFSTTSEELPLLTCTAYGTKIATPDGDKSMETFQTGDPVLVADNNLNWSTGKVVFSAGTGAGSSQPAMVYIHFGEKGSLIVSPDQLFRIPNGKYKRAARLVPGTDSLVAKDGSPAAICQVAIGHYTGGVHHISNDAEFAGTPDGHLLLAEGVVIGDFTLQINQYKQTRYPQQH